MKTKMAAIGVSALMLIMVAVPVVTADQYEDAQARYATAMQGYLDVKGEALKAQGEFRNARAQWRGNRSRGNFSGMVQAAGVAVQAQCNVMLKYMEMVRAQVEATRGLTDSEKGQIYGEIDGYMNELKAKQERVRNSENDQQIRTAAGEIEGYWLQIRIRLRQIQATAMLAYTEAMIQRVENFAAQIEARVQQLKDNGVDTTQPENLALNLRNRLQLAQQTATEARTAVGQITENSTLNEVFNAFRVRTREAVSYLKDAMNSLVRIMAQIQNRYQTGTQGTTQGTGTSMAKGNGRNLV